MATLDDVRDAMFSVAERAVGRALTSTERSNLIAAYNRSQGDIYDRCRTAVRATLGVDIDSQVLLEKSASVDRLRNALANLKAVAQAAAANRGR